MACVFVVFVVVDSFELDWLAVDQEDVALDFEAAETDRDAGEVAVGIDKQGVEVGGFCAPG